jgi:flagellar biosynthesis component FlhA
MHYLRYYLSLSFISEYYYYIIHKVTIKIFGKDASNTSINTKHRLSNSIVVLHLFVLALVLIKYIGSLSLAVFILFGGMLMFNYYEGSKNFYGENRHKMLEKLEYISHHSKISFIIIYSIFPILLLLALL